MKRCHYEGGGQVRPLAHWPSCRTPSTASAAAAVLNRAATPAGPAPRARVRSAPSRAARPIALASLFWGRLGGVGQRAEGRGPRGPGARGQGRRSEEGEGPVQEFLRRPREPQRRTRTPPPRGGAGRSPRTWPRSRTRPRRGRGRRGPRGPGLTRRTPRAPPRPGPPGSAAEAGARFWMIYNCYEFPLVLKLEAFCYEAPCPQRRPSGRALPHTDAWLLVCAELGSLYYSRSYLISPVPQS